MEKLKYTTNGTLKLAEKIDRNSFWETYVPNCFYWHSAEKAKKVTECGKKALAEMMKQLNLKKF